jgi:hypothetical protein
MFPPGWKAPETRTGAVPPLFINGPERVAWIPDVGQVRFRVLVLNAYGVL